MKKKTKISKGRRIAQLKIALGAMKAKHEVILAKGIQVAFEAGFAAAADPALFQKKFNEEMEKPDPVLDDLVVAHPPVNRTAPPLSRTMEEKNAGKALAPEITWRYPPPPASAPLKVEHTTQDLP